MSKTFVQTRLSAILSMRDQVMNWPEIAGATEWSGSPDALAQSFYKVAKEMGLDTRKPLIKDKYTAEDVKAWGEMKLSFSQVNALTGLSYVSVQNLCEIHGVKLVNMRGKNGKVSREAIYKLSEIGLNQSEIAVKLNCSRSVVGDVLTGRRDEYPIDEMPLSMQVPKEVRSIALGAWR